MIVSTVTRVETRGMVNDRGNVTAAAIPSAASAHGLVAISLEGSVG